MAKDMQSLFVLPTNMGGRVVEWISNSTHNNMLTSISDAIHETPSLSLVSMGAAATLGAMGVWWMSTAKQDGLVRPLCDLNSQTRILKDGSRVCKYVRSDNLVRMLYADASTLYELVRRGARKSTSKMMLGSRIVQPDGTAPYKWITYDEAIGRSIDIAYAFRELDLPAGQETCIGIYSKNRPEWIFIEHATYAFNNVLVPLYETLGAEASTYIINETELKIVVCDTIDKARTLIKQRARCPLLRIVVVMESKVAEEDAVEAKSADIKLLTFAELERRGRAVTYRQAVQPPTPDDLATICYTSGTTGVHPKGVMLTHGNVLANVSTLDYFKDIAELDETDVMMSFLPLAHMFERIVQAAIYAVGGCVGFFRGDIKVLGEDIKELRPTVLPGVPRVFNRVYDKVMCDVNKSAIKQTLFNAAIAYKTRELHNCIIRKNSFADQIVFKKIREGLGGRLKLVITGSAPINGHVLNFIRCALGCSVIEGYGQTEAVAAVTVTLPGDAVTNTVGVPSPCNSIKLVDVPELGYFAKDDAGEICVRGANVFKGYYKNEKLTREVLDNDGWLHTGDVGRWTERGTLQIIDRKKNILKLAQGEYVSPQRVEDAYLPCSLVQQIYVAGHSLQDHLVAVVVVEAEELQAWWMSEIGEDKPLAEICEDNRAREHLLKEMTRTGKDHHLNGIEQVKAVHLEPKPWTIADFLTPTLKSKRPQLRDHYKTIIERLYQHA